MAELFSLMPESTSCKNDRVEANRNCACPYSRALPLSGKPCLTAPGAALPAIRMAGGTAFSLYHRRCMSAPGFLPEPALSNAEGVEMTEVGLAHEYRRLSRSRGRHSEPLGRGIPRRPCSAGGTGFSLRFFLVKWRRAVRPPSTEVATLATADGPKIEYQKDARSEPNRRNRQRLQGVYFLDH